MFEGLWTGVEEGYPSASEDGELCAGVARSYLGMGSIGSGVSHFPWGSILLGWGLFLGEGFDLVTGLQNQYLTHHERVTLGL